MAADRLMAERGIVEIKMGKSKFPGKPSKIGNRKRVNLSSCALPEDNDSSKAAKNIYLGLSVFNETFGDNEMIAPGPFHGFSMAEVEEAMAEARLQQKEAEVEHKKQGITINLWDTFQSELFSIISCSTNDCAAKTTALEVNKTKLSFDGGGSCKKTDFTTNFCDNSDNWPSKIIDNRSVENSKAKEFSSAPKRKLKQALKFQSPRLKLCKLQCSSGSNKSLQSQAAKRLLEKAKMANLLESNKNTSAEKKFILPSHSIHSSRVIKPNKRFLEENMSKRKFVEGHSELCKKLKFTNSVEDVTLKTSIDKKLPEEIKEDITNGDSNKKSIKKDGSFETKPNEMKNSIESSKNSLVNSSTGKIILREARLQLDNSNISLLEGPFSTPSASSLSPNSQLSMNPMQSVTAPGNIVCGVCGIVRFYKFVELARKFGIYCCEFCQKFISKIIKSFEIRRDLKLQCLKGNGLCGMNLSGKTQDFNNIRPINNSKCQACWLKLCLKNFQMPINLKEKLIKVLPMNMQISINLEYHSKSSEITNSFKLSNHNIKDFKWFNENISHEIKSVSNDNISERPLNWLKSKNSNILNEKSLRKRTRNAGNENSTKVLCTSRKVKGNADEKNRQMLILKGPRVKHVCRSASVVLGQPLATFPSDLSPIKKQTNDGAEDCKSDNTTTTNNNSEAQVINKSDAEDGLSEAKQSNKDKKASSSKESYLSKGSTSRVGQQITTNKSKKKNGKIENPVSMDFWESYDPEEICETGFGLIGSETFTVRALCFLCGSSGREKLIHCASCCEPYHEFCVDEAGLKLDNSLWKYDWVCPRCTICFTCGRTSGQQLKCVKCDNSYHIECVDRVGGRLLHSPDRPWVCSVCLRCKSCNGVDVSIFVGNLPLCKSCFLLRQKGNYCPLCQRCYEDDDYDSKMMECGQCKCWVHAKCEGLSDEKYQVLSFLPESVEYVCRMCCVMPPAPWWLAVEAELKSGYLGVLKALSKNRKACTMLKWSPRKQCTCRQVDYVSRALDFEETKCTKGIANDPYTGAENSNIQMKEENKLDIDKAKDKRGLPACISQRKTSIEVINHPTESLKLTLKIMKGADIDVRDKINTAEMVEDVIQVHGVKEKYNNKENTVRVKKCPLNEKNSENFTNFSDYNEESQISSHCFINKSSFEIPQMEVYGKKAFPSASNRPSDSGLGSTDDELKGNCFTDEKSSKLDDLSSRSHRGVEAKSNCDTSVSFLEEKRECFCFLEVDSYHSRSKPFSPNLMSIKKKVTTSEYSSLHQFHQDMERMIATTHSVELMDLYHQTIKEVFPWFDPKFSKVQSSSQKVLGTTSLDSTPVKNTPVKNTLRKECTVLKEKLYGKSLDYFYSDNIVKDERICLMCKTVGDGPPGDTGRLLYCGQNEWVHCNCALWSGEVFEEIDGSLQNVHSAISRGRSIRCPECNLKGASIGCCARNCQETYHFSCARKIGCVFMDDKTMYCPAHIKESIGKLVQNEKEFEIRRPVYVELDKRKMKNADSGQIRFAVGALQVNNLGRFVVKLSDQTEAIIPEQFNCTRLYWSCYEPWRIVKYHFTIRLVETEDYGVDMGVNLTIDHSLEPHLLELKLKQLWHFQHFNTFLETSESLTGENLKEKNKLSEFKTSEGVCKLLTDEKSKIIASSRTKKDQKVAKKVLDQFDSKEDENCLSDNQNTADLLPPDIEEAIFKDLPHDILDGISMQDIFMDIKNDSYENGLKDSTVEDPSEVEDNFENSTNKSKKNEFNADSTSQNEFWVDTNECRSEIMEESFTVSKLPKDLKKIKIEGSSNQPNKKSATLKTYQKSCNLNWNCKTDGPNNKWKKNSKCHVTVNLLEPQERGNMLQELKFTDGLVAISTGAICTMKDFKSRLEDNKRSIQEEGKENKCLSWQTRLQPRLLQVDGGVDSSSSGSEAGESPQRLVDDNINSKSIVSSQSLPFLDSPMYSLSRPKYSEPTNLSYSSNYSNASRESYDHSSNRLMNNLPQLDGAGDFYSDLSDSEEIVLEINKLRKRRKHNDTKKSIYDFSILPFKVNQCDGGMDSEFEEEELTKCSSSDDITCSTTPSQTEDEPVKCNKCHCTYRTNNSYQRHLESCSSDFILSSSEGEMSDEESPKKHLNSASLLIKSDDNTPSLIQKTETENSLNNIHTIIPHPLCSLTKSFNDSFKNTRNQSPDDKKNLETKKEKTVKRTCVKKKLPTNTKKAPNTGNLQQMQQILVQQPNTAPALIVQDITAPNVLPTAFIDSTAALGYLTAVDSQNPFGKTHLIAAPNGIISGNFQFSSAPEAQLLGGLCLNSQNVQTNLPGFIIQQPHTPGTLLSSQQCPVMMSGEQMMLGSTGLYDVIQDPRTGGMFLTSYNQPVFYNMETIVSNTVMQTNQFVSNDLATTFSQTSTQIFQASEMEQVVNIPSNYIVVSPNPPTTDRYFSTEDLICIQSPQTLISNQNPIQITNQSLFNTSFPAVQAFDTDAKLMPTPINPLRCIQPICPSVVVSKITSTNANVINHPVSQVFQKSITPIATQPNSQIKVKQVLANKTQISNQCRSVPMMQPSTIKLTQDKIYERVGTPKLKVQQAQPGSRALVDYINNFRSDICDIVPTPLTPVPNAKHQNPDTNDPAAIKTIAADYSPPGINSKNCLSDKHPVPSKSKLSTSPIFFSPPKPRAEFKVPAEVSKKSKRSLPVGTFLSSTESSATESVQKTLKSIVLSSNASTLEKPDNSNQTSLKTVCSSKNQHSQMNAIGQGVKPELSQEIKTENVELPSVPLPKVLINRTNSFSFDRDVKKSLSMPRLDDSPASDQEEQLKVINEALSPKEKTTTEVLPLQENHHAINASGKSNSVQKVLSSDNKNLFPVSDENNKLKKKANLVVQNTLTSDISAKSENEVKEKTVFDALKMERAILLSPKKREEKGPKLIFEVISDDGFKSSSASMAELWANICDSVQEMRATVKIPVLPVTRKGHEVLGMHNHGLQHCLEQLRGVEQCSNYKCKYFFKDVQKNEDEEEEVKENLSGCARTEKFINRKEYDMFAWLASKHRELPKLTETAEETLSTIRRANNLPMAMRYRNLRETAKLYLGVYRSKIHGRGLFCLREIEAGEMVIEYAGEVIRSNLTDKREKYYTDKGIGCYMFKIDDHFVVDATMKGNAARFINHSCEPNCYSRVVDILGKKHIVIFALRKINIMEELTYDYKFPFEDEKISCHCLSKKCKKYLN